MKTIILFWFQLFLFAFLALPALSQVDVQMSAANNGMTFNTCAGTLFDSGGQGGSGYQNGENVTVVICPDNPGDVITLDFLSFNLNTTNTAPPPGNNIDNLAIYDGNSTAAASLGVYTGNQLQGLIVTCTSFNTSGCITLVFNSNSAGTGVFAAAITCSTPCQRPIAALAVPVSNQLKICPGESVSFDGSPSTAAAGFTIDQYLWNFDDGSLDSTSGPVVSHQFNDPGEYLVDLFLFDNNDCASTNRVTVQVLVGTVPSFAGISGDTSICLGEDVCLNGVVTGTLYTGMPGNNLGGATYLPDNVGQCFESTIEFNVFSPGQSLTNINDLLDICVTMEHSFMGDLVATIYCPNGQSVVMHQQGGGATFLGEPVDVSGPNDPPGVGYVYCWSPTATNGTWVDNSLSGSTPNVVPVPSGGNALAPGTYESLNPLSGLVGCPLNGTWTLEFCDLWGADDGWVFDWTINFNPALIPPITTFTPVYGAQCDSTFWTPVGASSAAIITSTSANCNQICVYPQSTGSFPYTFSATDDFGCTYDTTITITVTPPPVPDAGPDLIACPNSPIQLNATVPNTGAPCDYTLQLHDSFGDGWNGASLTVIVNGTPTVYTMNSGSNVDYIVTLPAGATFDIVYSSGTWESEVTYEIVDCNGNVVFSDGPNPATGTVYSGMNGLDIVYQWSPTTGLSNPNIPNPIATVSSPTTYYVTIYENGHPLCSTMDSVTITIDQSVYAGQDDSVFLCYNDPAFDMVPYLGTGINTNGSWFDPAFQASSNMFDPAVFPNGGNFSYIVPGTVACPSDTAVISVTVYQSGDPNCCAVTFQLAGTDISCNGFCDGEIQVSSIGGQQFSLDGGTNWQADSLFTGLCPGTYTIGVMGAGGCVNTSQITLSEPPSLTVDIINIQNVSCATFADGSLEATPSGGTAPYQFLWDDNCSQTSAIAANNCIPAGNYCVTVTDDNGCTANDCDVVTEPTPLTMNFLAVDASCFGTCDGNATVIPAGGTAPYSYNWNGIPGTTSTTTQAINLCAGNYNLTVTDANGCIIDTLNFPISQPAQLVVNSVVTVDETCFQLCDGSITIDAPNAVTFSIDNGVTFQPTGVFNGLCTGTYAIIIQDVNDCVASNSAVISGPAPVQPFFEFGPQPTTTFNPTIQFLNLSNGAISYSWNFSGLGTSTDVNPSFTFPDDTSGVYNVCLDAQNANGCSEQICFDVVIDEEFVFYAPNAFSPNGDNFNEVFNVYGNDIDPTDFELLIFDRWGNLIFTSNSLDNGWDGTHLGQKCQIDVYVWKAKVVSKSTGEFKEKFGHVTLIR